MRILILPPHEAADILNDLHRLQDEGYPGSIRLANWLEGVLKESATYRIMVDQIGSN